MKLQIIELDPHDDHVSARDKLARVKADRVLLVWPRRGRVLQRRLDLVLLHRKASQRGLQLGLLSHDPQVRDHAARLGIPLFDALDELPENRWRKAREPERPEPRSREAAEDSGGRPQPPPVRAGVATGPRWLRATALTLAALSLLALVAVLLPSATLVVRPESFPHSTELTIELTTGNGPTSMTESTMVVNRLETTVTVSERQETSGLISLPDSSSAGSLLFTNLFDEVVTIPAGTSVRASIAGEPRFLTVEPASLPASRGAQVEVAAKAAEAGRGGNVSAGRIDTVDGPIGLKVSVSNPDPFEGGGEKLAPAVGLRDRQQLRAATLELTQTRGQESLREDLGPSDVLIAGSAQIVEVVNEEYDVETGEVAPSLGLQLTAIVSAFSYRQEDLRNQIQAALEGQPDNLKSQIVPGTLELERLSYQPGEPQAPALRVSVTYRSYRPPPRSILAAVAGQEPAAVASLMEPFAVRLVRLERRPAWFPRMPFVASRIEISYPWEVE